MKPYHRITVTFFLFGVLWITGTDRLSMLLFAEDAEVLTRFQTMKGWFFVGLASLLVGVLTRRAFEVEHAKEQEKLAVFRKTVGGVYHVLFNYLNQMQMVTLEAEQCEHFDPETLEVAQEATREATAVLKRLEHLDPVTVDEIDAVMFGPTGRAHMV